MLLTKQYAGQCIWWNGHPRSGVAGLLGEITAVLSIPVLEVDIRARTIRKGVNLTGEKRSVLKHKFDS
jgi:hypothetical protein